MSDKPARGEQVHLGHDHGSDGRVPADFTVGGYRQLLEGFRLRGYESRPFDDCNPERPHLLLRHDIDISIDAAVYIADIERELGIRATYFVMLRTEMYNPFSQSSLAGLTRVADLGHQIGLHFDSSYYDSALDALDAAVERECGALEGMTGRRVEIVSFHRPPPALQRLDRSIGGRHHTYEPQFITTMGYCSDSRGGWHYGHPMDHPKVAEGRALQLLTHPIWWVAAPGETVREKLDRFALRRFDVLRAELARNCAAYPQEFGTLDVSDGKPYVGRGG